MTPTGVNNEILDTLIAHAPSLAQTYLEEHHRREATTLNMAQLQQIMQFARDGYVQYDLAIAIGDFYARSFMQANGIKEPGAA